MIRLQIEQTGSAKLGSCYYSHTFRIKSLNSPLTKDEIDTLRGLGFLGYGQEFICDYTNFEEDIEGDDHNAYYIVTCESRVDSSD